MARTRARSTLFRGAIGATGFDPVSLFAKYSASGFYYDLTETTGLYQDAAATTPVTADGQSIGYADDRSPGGNNGTQSTAAAKPTLKTGAPNYASHDGGDYLDSGVVPSTSGMTLAACFRGNAAADIIMGSGSGGNCFISLNTDGKFSGGYGSESFGVILGGSDITGADHVGLMRANASTVELWLDGARIYQAASSGSPNTSYNIAVGAFNNGGSYENQLAGRIYRPFCLKGAYIDDADVVPLMRALGSGVVSI